MFNQEKFLSKAIEEVRTWFQECETDNNYPNDFSKVLINKLEIAKKADSIQELEQHLNGIYRYQIDSGPLTEISPSLNQLAVAIDKYKRSHLKK